MSQYKEIMMEKESLNEISLSSGVAKLLSKIASLMGKDTDIIDTPEIKSAAQRYVKAVSEFRKEIANYERLNGPVPPAVKALLEV